MVKMDPPKLVPPGTNFSINKDPRNISYSKTLLKNLDQLPQMKNVDLEHISLTKLGPVAYLRGFQGIWKLPRSISSAACNVL